MCYYRIEATVTGIPEPEIEFGEDDNVNPLGSGRVEVGVEVGGSYTLNTTSTNSAGTATASIILVGECAEGEAGDEEASDEEAGDEGETEEEADEEAEEEADADSDSEKEAPTINLEIYEGPTLEGSICYSRVRATVTGSPNPTISFSKDDSGGFWLPKKVQVNLNNPGDTYTLTATATNSEGSATDSITLIWGCEEPEPEPEPEPEEELETEPEAIETSIAADRYISGNLTDSGAVFLSVGSAVMGDTGSDSYSKSYVSFDISGLHGKTVQDAEINFIGINGYGNPESLASSIVVKVYNYVRLDASDFAMGGVHLVDIPISAASYTISGNTLKNELQDVVDNEIRDYFQLKLGLNVTTNSDGIPDGITIGWNRIVLYISYTD
jgi:hypothetical protein